ncbi:hypothetical protein LZ31DRAFT_372507 [Colletotrichum somersetense]|nr:hypothetical protein LZ31DRAFT_372507 [Colletotrichum somersetense]
MGTTRRGLLLGIASGFLAARVDLSDILPGSLWANPLSPPPARLQLPCYRIAPVKDTGTTALAVLGSQSANTSASRVVPGLSNRAALRRLETGHPGWPERRKSRVRHGGAAAAAAVSPWTSARPEKPMEAFLFRAVIRTAPCLVC